MGIFSRFENRMEDTVEGAASRMSKAPISPVQIAKRAEKQMRRETMVGAGKEYAPTLYTVLVNPDDDARLFGYYPTLAGETETYLKAKAAQEGLVMDGDPLVRFIVDEGLKHGKFEVIAEAVAAPIIVQLRAEEMERYGLLGAGGRASQRGVGQAPAQNARAQAAPPQESYYDDDYDQDYDEYDTGYGSYDDFGNYESGFDQVYTDFDDPQFNVPPTAAPMKPAMRPSNTIAYAGNSRDNAGAPDFRKVRARLIDLETQRPYDLGSATITLGRDTSNSIPVNDLSASRHHAELKMTPQGLWVVTDLNSTNGTFVNGQKIVSQQLYAGDVITIGKTDFELALAR